eukprot:g7647.t1
MSLMSEQTIQRVFHQFTERFAEEFFPKLVRFPEGADRAEVLKEYADVGWPGCLGSTDVTHIRSHDVEYGSRWAFIGKEGVATVAFETTCDHKLRCLGATRAFPGAQNGKTIVRFDEYITKLNPECNNVEYTLPDEEGEPYTEKGLYVIVDGGYPNWRCLQCPFSLPVTREELIYRERLESVRKDIECFFGILKGRFRILKMPLLYRGIYKLDSIYQTCCALHNMLHAFDGLGLLEKDVDYAGKDGDLDPWVSTPEEEPTFPDITPDLEVFQPEHTKLQRKLVINLAEMMKVRTVGWRRS